MLEIIGPFTFGLVGSLHCLGMCGPLILAWSFHCNSTPGALSQNHKSGGWRGFSAPILHHISFHGGRMLSYGILGAVVAGFFGSIEVQRFSMVYRGSLLIFLGGILLALGLIVMRIIPLPSFLTHILSPPASLFGKKLAGLAGSSSPTAKIALGLYAGLLPCGLTWAMLVMAASTLSPLKGMLAMVSFGAGTVPLLLLTGISASFLSVRTRLTGERVAAFCVLAMGTLLSIQGVGALWGACGHCCGWIPFYEG